MFELEMVRNMAILIIINKVEENEKTAFYKYGFGAKSQGKVIIKEVKGKVSIDKISGNIKSIEFYGDQKNRIEFFIDRVSKVLQKHYQSNEFPESTYYMA